MRRWVKGGRERGREREREREREIEIVTEYNHAREVKTITNTRVYTADGMGGKR